MAQVAGVDGIETIMEEIGVVVTVVDTITVGIAHGKMEIAAGNATIKVG